MNSQLTSITLSVSFFLIITLVEIFSDADQVVIRFSLLPSQTRINLYIKQAVSNLYTGVNPIMKHYNSTGFLILFAKIIFIYRLLIRSNCTFLVVILLAFYFGVYTSN